MNATESSFWSTICTSLGSTALVGFLFWSWLTGRFKVLEDHNKENRARIRELELHYNSMLTKDDHFEIRKEDKDQLEKQMNEVKSELRGMPERIVNLLKPFLNK